MQNRLVPTMKNGLLLGLDGSGKTLFLRQVRAHCEHNSTSNPFRFLCRKQYEVAIVEKETTPTTGVEYETFTFERFAFSLREVGGPMLPMWKAYFKQCDFIIVSVSSTPVEVLMF